jgi:hypothetical protein
MPKSKFGQAHCEEWFKRSPTKFISKFLGIPTSFYKLWKLALFSGILKELKNDKNRRTVSGLKLAHDPVQPRRWPATRKNGACATCARGAVTARSSSARRRGDALDGGAVGAGRRQGAASEHRRGPSLAPGRRSGGGAHPSSGST